MPPGTQAMSRWQEGAEGAAEGGEVDLARSGGGRREWSVGVVVEKNHGFCDAEPGCSWKSCDAKPERLLDGFRLAQAALNCPRSPTRLAELRNITLYTICEHHHLGEKVPTARRQPRGTAAHSCVCRKTCGHAGEQRYTSCTQAIASLLMRASGSWHRGDDHRQPACWHYFPPIRASSWLALR